MVFVRGAFSPAHSFSPRNGALPPPENEVFICECVFFAWENRTFSLGNAVFILVNDPFFLVNGTASGENTAICCVYIGYLRENNAIYGGGGGVNRSTRQRRQTRHTAMGNERMVHSGNIADGNGVRHGYNILSHL